MCRLNYAAKEGDCTVHAKGRIGAVRGSNAELAQRTVAVSATKVKLMIAFAWRPSQAALAKQHDLKYLQRHLAGPCTLKRNESLALHLQVCHIL